MSTGQGGTVVSAGGAARREPWLAAALSLFAPGLGQVYCDEFVHGLALLVGSLVFTPLVVLAALLPPRTPVLAGLILAALAVLGLYLYAVVAAYRSARRARERHGPGKGNRPLVYVLFLLAGILSPACGAWFVPRVFAHLHVRSGAMAPTFLEGDHVLTDRLAYRRVTPKRGDVVLFRVPRKPGTTWIRRVIALPGDTVEMKGDAVLVNGTRLDRERVPTSSLRGTPALPPGDLLIETNDGNRYLTLLGGGEGHDYPRTRVPGGCVFVLGDHRDRALDSRDPDIGFVPLGDVQGNVPYIFFPAGSWQRFGAVGPWGP